MSIQELETELLQLSEQERAGIASRLLASLPPAVTDEDDGLAEAIRRDEEMDRDPAASMSVEEFQASMEK